MKTMKSLVVALSLGCALFTVGCGDDGDSSGSVDPKNCDSVGARYKSLSNAAGCKDDSAELTASCKQLRSFNICVSQFEALVSCIAPKPASDFTCDVDDELELKTDACKTQQDALDSCIADAG